MTAGWSVHSLGKRDPTQRPLCPTSDTCRPYSDLPLPTRGNHTSRFSFWPPNLNFLPLPLLPILGTSAGGSMPENHTQHIRTHQEPRPQEQHQFGTTYITRAHTSTALLPLQLVKRILDLEYSRVPIIRTPIIRILDSPNRQMKRNHHASTVLIRSRYKANPF